MQEEKIKKDIIKTKEKKPKNISPRRKADDFIMPTKENYTDIIYIKYTIKQLKDVITHYKIKLNGASTKADITAKICNYFKQSASVIVLQKAWRHYLWKHYNHLRGPARFNRRLCVNDSDFFTLDSIYEIPYQQFYSFVDTDKKVYGFDFMSLYNLFKKNTIPSNPYNRNPFPKQVTENMTKLLRYAMVLQQAINIDSNEGEDKSLLQNFETRLSTLFIDIDALGNYTNYNWFMALNQLHLMRFITEMNDIWSYRANLSEQVKREICPMHRELFQQMFIIDIRYASATILREIALDIMSKLVRDGINQSSRNLGATFVLCALTLVSPDAAAALPWLYESVI